MKKHKHHKVEKRPTIEVKPAQNGFVVELYDGKCDNEPLVFAEIADVLEYLVTKFN